MGSASGGMGLDVTYLLAGRIRREGLGDLQLTDSGWRQGAGHLAGRFPTKASMPSAASGSSKLQAMASAVSA